jgi:phage tail-like protein
MDANGTRYQLLLGPRDWLACSTDEARPGATVRPLSQVLGASPPLPSDVEWSSDHNELTLHERLYRFPPPPHHVAPTPAARRGAASDRFGSWYWIDATETEILVTSAGTKNNSHFWSAGDGTACPSEPGFGAFRPRDPAPVPTSLQLRGLAITEDHYLVVGVLEPKGLLVFDLHAGGPPTQVFWPGTVDFQPFDMASAPGGGVWILDRANRRYWALDRHMQVIARGAGAAPTQDAFQPSDPGLRRRPSGCGLHPIQAADAIPLTAHDPISIEGLPDGTVLILDRVSEVTPSMIQRYRDGQAVGAAVPVDLGPDLLDPTTDGSSAVVGHDFLFVPEHTAADGTTVHDRLYVASAQGDQSFGFLIDQYDDNLVLTPQADYLPMRLFGGRGLARGCGGPYYDSSNRWVPLAKQCRSRFAEEAFVYTPAGVGPTSPIGEVARPPFDGREPGCVWHRLMLDASIPPETEVDVWSRAADDPSDLIRSDWQPEPPLYLRADGSELPYVTPRTATGDGTWELLLQRARGRYLQLKLRLAGNGRQTPRLRALRAYYPRFSYLSRYLPSVYRADQASASFLDRFLANPEGTLTGVEDKIAAVQMLFDPSSAPAADLDWLAAWFGIALDPQWDDTRRRLFLRYAMLFFQYRGTVAGLEIALHLVLDACADETIFSDLLPVGSIPSQPGASAGGVSTNACGCKKAAVSTSASTPPQLRSFRIVEQFLTRQTPGIVFGDPSAGLLPARTATTGRWQPSQGGVALHLLFNQQQVSQGIPVASQMNGYPITPPTDPTVLVLWTSFSQTTIGFVPSAAASSVGIWQDFLDRRYHAISALNQAYGTTYVGFTQVPLPTALPPDGAPLVDWYQFQSVVLAMQRTAHRFTVLLPAPKQPDPDGSEHQRRYDLAQRVIDLEKPAHTVYDIKFYWAYFRVGQARLGDDTIVDRGSRAPELMPSMVLGRNYLAGSYLTPTWPQDVQRRQIVGRDRVKPSKSESTP